MISAYRTLPQSITVSGVQYRLNTVYHAAITVLAAWNDEELDDEHKTQVMMDILLPDWREIPPEHRQEAVEKVVQYLDCGQKDDGKNHPRVIDWDMDAEIIIPAVNSVAGGDIRTMPELHWWTFFSWFMEIKESLFSSVLNIRIKKAKHKKLEKWEQEFYKENRSLIDMNTQDAEEIRKEKEEILKWFKSQTQDAELSE